MKEKKVKPWKEYEENIHHLLKEQHPGTYVKRDFRIRGRYSERQRQIDVLIEGFSGGRKFRQIVECKFYNKKINVKLIESILGFLDDVSADRAIIITNKGYSKSAYKRAHNDPRFIELQICSFEELKEYQGLYALCYRGKNGLAIKAPMGWVTDNSQIGSKSTCNLYLRGKSIAEASKEGDLIMINIYDKSSNEINNVQEFQKSRNKALKKKHSGVVLSEIDTLSRNDATVLLDKIITPNNGMQFSGYLGFENFIVTIDLMITNENESNRYPVIEQLLFETKPYTTDFESDFDATFWNISEAYNTLDNETSEKTLFEEIKGMINFVKKEHPSELIYAKKYFEGIEKIMKLL